MFHEVEVFTDIIAELGEGPCWNASRSELTWVDILAGKLHRLRLAGEGAELMSSLQLGCPIGAAIPAGDGGWVLAAGTGFAHLSEDGRVSWLQKPEAGMEGAIRMNDAACDAAGRFWAGSMAYDESPGAGSLYCLEPDLSVRRVLGEVTIPNGIGWSRDSQTMWFIDSGPGTVDAFDYDLATGEATGRRTLIQVDPADGVPDGLAVDEDDCLWVAIWDCAEVRRYSDSGELLDRLAMPVSRPTSCCFGGTDLSTLFVTTAREGLSAEQLASEPGAGRLFWIDAGVRGMPTAKFTAADIKASSPSR